MSFDLLTTVAEGGCSAKLAPGTLARVLATIPRRHDPALLVDQSTRDDAAVYRLDASTRATPSSASAITASCAAS